MNNLIKLNNNKSLSETAPASSPSFSLPLSIALAAHISEKSTLAENFQTFDFILFKNRKISFSA
jgi:hypothetical protein